MRFLRIIGSLLLFGATAMAKDATSHIKVKGMTCGSCAVAVKKALASTRGVKSAEVSLDKGLVTVVYDDSQVNERQLAAAIDKTGFKAELAKETP